MNVKVDSIARTVEIPSNAKVVACDFCLTDKSVPCVLIVREDLTVRGCTILRSLLNCPCQLIKFGRVKVTEFKGIYPEGVSP